MGEVRANSMALPYWLSLFVVVGAAVTLWRVATKETSHALDSGSYSVPLSTEELTSAERASDPPISEFTLTDQQGEPFRSQDLAGEVWVASFFFSACPSVCVQQNQRLADLFRDEAFQDVRFVSVTCDPETDTPEVLAQYAERFGADPERWSFCTGDLSYIKRIANDMMKLSVDRYTHSERAVVIDRNGEVRGRYVVTDTNLANELALMKRELVKSLQENGPSDRLSETTSAERSSAVSP